MTRINNKEAGYCKRKSFRCQPYPAVLQLIRVIVPFCDDPSLAPEPSLALGSVPRSPFPVPRSRFSDPPPHLS
jgi:hypothetical protein